MNLFDQMTNSPEKLRNIQAERLLLETTELICEIMEREGIDRVELATRLGKNRAYVTRLLNGSTSMTIQTIADVFAALGRSLRVVDQPLSVFTPRLQVTEIPSQPHPVAEDSPRSVVAAVVTPDLNSPLTKN